MQDFINSFKRYFRGVFYILTLQWKKAWDLASGKDPESK
jgi:hypothetical protein